MTKRVEFLRTELYESEGRNKGPTFPKGSVWDMTDEFAHRWVTMRGVAVEIDETSDDLADGQRFVLVRQNEAVEGAESEDAPEPAPEAVPGPTPRRGGARAKP